MLAVRRLGKAAIPQSLLQDPSPANIQSTRLALHVNEERSSCWIYIASGCLVYKIEISVEDSLVIKGKESLLIPMQAKVKHSSLVNRCPHRSEIQSVVLAEKDDGAGLVLGTVDSFGHIIVSQLDASSQDLDRITYSALPRDCGVGEGSWAGICFSPGHWSTAVVARSLCKTIDVYDQDIHLRSLHTLWYPTALSFLSTQLSGDEKSILAVAEGCQLSIWDLRTNYNGGCVQRLCGSLDDVFYALSCSKDGNIAVGGSDRTITVYDPRRWVSLSRWRNCSKYEITGLSFSSVDSDHIYMQGVDYEVFCGQWKENKKLFSFKGDSNWLGFCKSQNGDVLGGWCESGSIFVADIVRNPLLC